MRSPISVWEGVKIIAGPNAYELIVRMTTIQLKHGTLKRFVAKDNVLTFQAICQCLLQGCNKPANARVILSMDSLGTKDILSKFLHLSRDFGKVA